MCCFFFVIWVFFRVVRLLMGWFGNAVFVIYVSGFVTKMWNVDGGYFYICGLILVFWSMEMLDYVPLFSGFVCFLLNFEWKINFKMRVFGLIDEFIPPVFDFFCNSV